MIFGPRAEAARAQVASFARAVEACVVGRTFEPNTVVGVTLQMTGTGRTDRPHVHGICRGPGCFRDMPTGLDLPSGVTGCLGDVFTNLTKLPPPEQLNGYTVVIEITLFTGSGR